jgi:hypothetical protein
MIAAFGVAPSLAPAAVSRASSPIGGVARLRLTVPRQYQNELEAISPSIVPSITNWKCCWIVAEISKRQAGSADREGNGGPTNGQYQPTQGRSGDDELMLRVGALLGLGYLAFLAIWIWATRLRAH